MTDRSAHFEHVHNDTFYTGCEECLADLENVIKCSKKDLEANSDPDKYIHLKVG